MYQDIYNCICQNTKKIFDSLSIMSNLQPNCCLKFDFQKVDQHAGGKWLIHDTKRRKDNQFGICVFRVPLEKSCKSVVSPYIFTVNISFLIVDTLRVKKNIVL